MFTTRLQLLLTICCFISWGVQAYYLDSSCLTVPNFQDSVSNAFDFASTAIKLQGDVNVQDLSNILFGSGGLPAALTTIAHFASLPAISTFQGVGGMKSGGVGDVLIACDFSRYQDKVEDGVLYHWDSVGDIAEEDDPVYQACSGGGGGGGRFQFAYTLTYEDDDNVPDLMQFCPWFLSYMNAQRWSSSSQVDPNWLINIPPGAADAIRRYKGTPIDLYGLLEATILHELTHTKAGGESDDIASDLQGAVGTAGWLYSASLSAQGSNNAENLSLFGLGAKLVQLGFKVDVNGVLTAIPTFKKMRGRSFVA